MYKFLLLNLLTILLFQIEMTASLPTAQSILAIQYLNVLNPMINRPECKNTPIQPVTPRPGTWPPTQIPQTPVFRNEVWWWVISSMCLAIVLVMIILIGIYCIIDVRNRRSHK